MWTMKRGLSPCNGVPQYYKYIHERVINIMVGSGGLGEYICIHSWCNKETSHCTCGIQYCTYIGMLSI